MPESPSGGSIDDAPGRGEGSLSSEDGAVIERFRRAIASGDQRERDAIVADHRFIAERCARRFANRGEPLDDLVQVASIGLMKAVERFDPEMGIPFPAYATPTIMGELRRHFRDATWAIRVPRRAKDLHVRIGPTLDRLHQLYGRAPTPAELAAELQVPEEHVLEALDAGAAYSTHSLDQPSVGGDSTGADRLGAEDALAALKEDRAELASLLESLPERERKIIYLRFFEDRSQAEIAAVVGTSQVHVSRLLRSSLETLRAAAAERH